MQKDTRKIKRELEEALRNKVCVVYETNDIELIFNGILENSNNTLYIVISASTTLTFDLCKVKHVWHDGGFIKITLE